MSVVGKLKTALRVYRDYGIRALGKEFCYSIYECTTFIAMRSDLLKDVPKAKSKIRFVLKRVSDEHLRLFNSMPYPFNRHYQYRFEYGQRRCYGAFVEDRIVALMWILFKSDNKRNVNRWRYLLPDEVRVADLWVDPDYRGTGLIDVCLEKFTRYFKKIGFRYFYVYTWNGNEKAKRLYFRSGFEIVGKVRQFRFAWQKPGKGIYFREPIQRGALSETKVFHEVTDLPEFIP